MAPGEEDSGPAELPRFFYRRDLGLVALAALMYALAAWFLPVALLTVPLGLFTLFFAPGYALGVLLLGYRPRWPWSLTFVTVVGLSVAWSVGEGLALLALGAGLPAGVLALGSLAVVGLAFLVPEPVPSPAGPAVGAYLRKEFRLPGHSSGQRAVGYTLLAAIVAVVLVIVYLATLFPGNAPVVSLGISGAPGAGPPSVGHVGETLRANATVANNATAQTLDLTVRAVLVGQAPTNFTSVPWQTPLPLGPNRSSTDPLALGGGSTQVVEVVFEFSLRGNYVLEFLLRDAGGALLVSTSTPVAIS